ncbi:S-adenosyl-L-methionine-dependent methyltransferase, partial [Peniophora sp. CONT]
MSSHSGHSHSHDHGHAHHHDHSHGHDHGSTVEHNEAYFDELAEKYENVRGARELLAHLGSVLRNAASLDTESTTVLDFACGIGMLSREIAPYVKSIVGVDVSKGSIGVYNRKAAEAGASDKMSAVALDLKGTPGELNDKKFDVATCTMAYHHFDSPQTYTKTLVHYLKPGGKLLVADLMPNAVLDTSKATEKMRAAVPHMHGFTESAMQAMFEDAGLVDIKYTKVWRG